MINHPDLITLMQLVWALMLFDRVHAVTGDSFISVPACTHVPTICQCVSTKSAWCGTYLHSYSSAHRFPLCTSPCTRRALSGSAYSTGCECYSADPVFVSPSLRVYSPSVPFHSSRQHVILAARCI